MFNGFNIILIYFINSLFVVSAKLVNKFGIMYQYRGNCDVNVCEELLLHQIVLEVGKVFAHFNALLLALHKGA